MRIHVWDISLFFVAICLTQEGLLGTPRHFDATSLCHPDSPIAQGMRQSALPCRRTCGHASTDALVKIQPDTDQSHRSPSKLRVLPPLYQRRL